MFCDYLRDASCFLYSSQRTHCSSYTPLATAPDRAAIIKVGKTKGTTLDSYLKTREKRSGERRVAVRDSRPLDRAQPQPQHNTPHHTISYACFHMQTLRTAEGTVFPNFRTLVEISTALGRECFFMSPVELLREFVSLAAIPSPLLPDPAR